jgi:hypothetical protein
MLTIMKSGSRREDVDRVSQVVQGLGFEPRSFRHAERVFRVVGCAGPPHPELFDTLRRRTLSPNRPAVRVVGEG